jgi:hypothetical protein
MHTYSYSLSKKYNKIIIIQSFWRKYKLSQILLKNTKSDLGSIILNKLLNMNTTYNIVSLLLKDTSKEISICNKKLIKYITVYKLLIKTSIILKNYINYQLKQNISKLIFLLLINETICDIDRLNINTEYLESLTNQYLNISALKIDNKYNILKNILNQHILKTEEILMQYNNYGHQKIYQYVKKINNSTYYIIYNKFIRTHHITDSNFDYQTFYNKLINFLNSDNIYNFLFLNNIAINIKIINNFNDKINTISACNDLLSIYVS